MREARQAGGAGAAAKEASSEAGRIAAQEIAAKKTAGLSRRVPVADRAAGRVGSFAGKAAFTATAVVAGGILLFVVLIIAAFGGLSSVIAADQLNRPGRADSAPGPTEEQCRSMPSGWCHVVYSAQRKNDQRGGFSVPWTVLAGLAAGQTDFGRTSPYDATDRYPNRPTPAYLEDKAPDLAPNTTAEGTYVETGTATCPVAPSETPIVGAGAGQQGVGPFLVRLAAIDDDGGAKAAADPCRAAEFVARKLSDAADALVKEKKEQEDAAPGSTEPSPDDTGPLPENAAFTPELQAFWQQVIDRANILVAPVDFGATCTADRSNGRLPAVDLIISDIWTCELGRLPDLHVVSGGHDSGGKMTYSVLSRAAGTAVLISEAQAVSWNFSQWTPVGCTAIPPDVPADEQSPTTDDSPSTDGSETPAGEGETPDPPKMTVPEMIAAGVGEWKDDGTDLAGIFPLTKAQAKAAGIANRCVPDQNIAAAAQLVAAIEQIPPKDRPAPAGQPYLPMIGGWANIPQALGTTPSSFALVGPPKQWQPSDDCSAVSTAFLLQVTEGGSPFADLAGTTDLPTDTAKYTAAIAATRYNPFKSPACAGGTNSQIASFLTERAATFASEYIDDAATPDIESPALPQGTTTQEPTLGESTDPAAPSTGVNEPASPDGSPTSFLDQLFAEAGGGDVPPDIDPSLVPFSQDAMLGVSNWFNQQAHSAQAPTQAIWGKDSMVARLSSVASTIDQGPKSPLHVRLDTGTWQSHATDWAVFYGGLGPDWDSHGTRIGSLLINAGYLTGGVTALATTWASASQQAQLVIDAAQQWLGTPYAWGGGNASGPTKGIRDGGVADKFGDYNKIGFDCSGLTLYAYNVIGVKLPHLSRQQATMGRPVASLDVAQPGDLLFFYSPVTHVAIYLGNGQMLEAPQSGDVVRISNVRNNITHIRRFVTDNPVAAGANVTRTTAGSVPPGTAFFVADSPCPVSLGNKSGYSNSAENLRECQPYIAWDACPAVAVNPSNVPIWVSTALAELYRTGFPRSTTDAEDLTLIITNESHGDPCVVNAWDSNWKNAHPSFGLTQTIPSTFERWALPGFEARWDPVSQVIAGARYANSRYGSLRQVPGVAAVHAGKPYRGY